MVDVDVTGIEPVTPCLQRLCLRRINELHGALTNCHRVRQSQHPQRVGVLGFEPIAPTLSLNETVALPLTTGRL